MSTAAPRKRGTRSAVRAPVARSDTLLAGRLRAGRRRADPKPASQLPADTGPAKPVRALDQSSLDGLLGYRLRRAEVHMRQLVIKALADWDIRPPEYSVLALIAGNALVTQADLGHALNIKRPNMVTLIEKLERRGLVTREVHALDRRNHILTLSEKGEAQLADIDGLLHDMDRQWTACWSARERQQVARLLQRLYQGPDVKAE